MNSSSSSEIWGPDILLALGTFMRDRASTVCLRCSMTGDVVGANAFAQKILATNVVGRNLRELFLEFQNIPDFAHLIDQEMPQMISLPTSLGVPQTYYFAFVRLAEQILVIGETHQWEIEQMRLELVRLNRELSNMTRELAKKNADLSRLNEVKNEFLGLAAHDLRGPIANIIGLSELLSSNAAPRLQSDDLYQLSLIRQLSESMLILLNDLLDITAIEAGKLRLSYSWFVAGDLVKQAVALSQIHAQSKNSRIDVKIPEDLLMYGDQRKLLQVFANLVSNAVKFSPYGSTVLVEACEARPHVRVLVHDQGPGIAPDELTRLFKPYARGSAVPTAGEKSTGLGLAIVQKIVAAHQGTVRVEPASDRGSVFVVEIPIGADEHQIKEKRS